VANGRDSASNREPRHNAIRTRSRTASFRWWLFWPWRLLLACTGSGGPQTWATGTMRVGSATVCGRGRFAILDTRHLSPYHASGGTSLLPRHAVQGFSHEEGSLVSMFASRSIGTSKYRPTGRTPSLGLFTETLMRRIRIGIHFAAVFVSVKLHFSSGSYETRIHGSNDYKLRR
jgi:hypothetical protein